MSGATPPQLIAHRGLPRQHRENTLPGFLAATSAGAAGWELDVHGTRDGVIVVHHDPVLPRSVGSLAGASIAELDWAAIASLAVGPAGETIPTLDAVMRAAGSVTVFVEIKARAIEAAVVDVLLEHQTVRAAIHSFDHRVARTVAQIAPQIPTGILVDSYLIDPAHALHGARARDYWAHHSMVDEALVDVIHGAGGRVIVWTVNDAALAAHLTHIGVDAICTDLTDVMRPNLAN